MIRYLRNKKARPPERETDMYPLYWTTSKGGILMRYSYEFKRKAIELFYQGEWPKTPAGVSTHIFHNQIREWVKLEQVHGPDINKCRGTNKHWSPKEKYELVCQVLSGQGLRTVAIVAGINSGQLYQWVHKYKTGFINTKLWDTMVLLINLKDDHQRIAK